MNLMVPVFMWDLELQILQRMSPITMFYNALIWGHLVHIKNDAFSKMYINKAKCKQ